MTQLHRDDLIRMVELPAADLEFRAAETDNGSLGTLAGYAAVFDSPTVIDSWEGRFTEKFMHGAFRDTLSKDGDKIKVLFNHGLDPSIGDKPLGKPAVMEERKRGLYVEVPLDGTSYNKDLVASLRSGALDGMSIRFSVVREDVDDSDDAMPVRTVKQARLFEFGPVTFPAYEATTAGVRGRDAYRAWRTAHPAEISADDDPVSAEPVSDESPTLEPVRSEPDIMPVRRIDPERLRRRAEEYARRSSEIQERYVRT